MRRKLLLQLTLLAFATSGSLYVSGQLSGQYQQDFEGPFPPSGWQVKNVLDPSYTWVKTTAQHHSGTHSTYVHYSSDASSQAEDWLILPQFTVAASDSFSFWLAAQFVNYVPDSTVILVSTTDSNLSSFTNVIGVLSEPNTYPVIANVFEYYSFSLGAYAGQNIFVALKNRNKDGDGLYVDLVTIGTPPPALSIAAISVDVPDSVSLVPFSPMGTVKNKSDATQTFPVTMTITGGYSSTMNVTNLDPGELQQITFDPWTPVAGVATITMETQLPTDTIPSDNIKSKVVMAIDTDVAVASIDVPVFVSNLSSIIPRATVKNYSLTVESFSVTMNITGGYTSTKNVTNLAPGARQQIDFDVWTPASGAFTVSVQTQLVSDVIADDDTLSKVVTAVPPISGYYQEDFEGAFPPFGWQTLDVLDHSEVWVQNTDIPYSGTYNTYMSYSPVDVQGEDWLILPQWSVAASDSFSFWLAVQSIPFPPDSTEILISTTDAYPSSFTDVLGILSQGDNYPGAAFTYEYYSFSLAAYAGQNIYVALRNRNIYGDGIYVDLVSIGTPPATNATAISIDVPDMIFTTTFSPLATVKNSSVSVQSFPVTLTITGGYTSTMNVSNLGAGAIQQITFDPWTPNAGVSTLLLQTQLTGDLNPVDDTITREVNALEPFINYGWITKTASPEAIWDEGLASVNTSSTSRLYTLAGVNSFTLISDVNTYDPVGDAWSSLSSMATANYNSCAAAINGRIYVIGGYNPPFVGLGDNQIYDITTDSWSDGTAMPTPVGDYAIGIYKDSLLYYMGGYNSGSDYDAVQIYDPLNDSWATGTNVPGAAYGWQGGIIGNKIVLCCGASSATGLLIPTTYVGTIDASNPANITWVQADDYPIGTVFRPGAGASIDTSSGLLVFTGGDPDGTATSALSATFAFDVNSNSWKYGPDKPTAVNNLRNLTCVVFNDSLYIVSVGGLDAASNELDVNEWLNLGPAPFATSITESNPADFDLSSYPNPFSKFTSISFSLDQSSAVNLSIVDVMGKEVAVLCNKTLPAGAQQITWNASGYPAGVYFCKMNVNGTVTTQKLVKLN